VPDGPGRLLVALYGLFALAAGARATVQLPREVTLPYVLSAVAAAIYLVAAVARSMPDETVWSGFGAGYGYVPLVLPLLGLAWLSTSPRVS
jgi:ABC-type spermidine/putrescine transport system permease subunit II